MAKEKRKGENSMSDEYILEINNLRTSFFTEELEVKAVNGVTLKLPKGKTLGIVGESGSGKSITALSILQLLERPGKIVGGEIMFKGQDFTKMGTRDIRKIRGNEISMIFEEPMTSLNPVNTIGQQMSEALIIQEGLYKEEQRKRSVTLLEVVGIPSHNDRVAR